MLFSLETNPFALLSKVESIPEVAWQAVLKNNTLVREKDINQANNKEIYFDDIKDNIIQFNLLGITLPTGTSYGFRRVAFAQLGTKEYSPQCIAASALIDNVEITMMFATEKYYSQIKK